MPTCLPIREAAHRLHDQLLLHQNARLNQLGSFPNQFGSFPNQFGSDPNQFGSLRWLLPLPCDYEGNKHEEVPTSQNLNNLPGVVVAVGQAHTKQQHTAEQLALTLVKRLRACVRLPHDVNVNHTGARRSLHVDPHLKLRMSKAKSLDVARPQVMEWRKAVFITNDRARSESMSVSDMESISRVWRHWCDTTNNARTPPSDIAQDLVGAALWDLSRVELAPLRTAAVHVDKKHLCEMAEGIAMAHTKRTVSLCQHLTLHPSLCRPLVDLKQKDMAQDLFEPEGSMAGLFHQMFTFDIDLKQIKKRKVFFN
jgi:hypothetical protein